MGRLARDTYFSEAVVIVVVVHTHGAYSMPGNVLGILQIPQFTYTDLLNLHNSMR